MEIDDNIELKDYFIKSGWQPHEDFWNLKKDPVTGKPMRDEKGDVVKLKSGGPDMTVSAIKKDGIFEVVYFDLTGKLQVNSFHGVCLYKVTNK